MFRHTKQLAYTERVDREEVAETTRPDAAEAHREEISHIEMLATAVALNQEGAPSPTTPAGPAARRSTRRANSASARPSRWEVPKLAPAEERPELHSVPIPAKGGALRKAKDALTP
jgi:Mn-containing catalase